MRERLITRIRHKVISVSVVLAQIETKGFKTYALEAIGQRLGCRLVKIPEKGPFIVVLWGKQDDYPIGMRNELGAKLVSAGREWKQAYEKSVSAYETGSEVQKNGQAGSSDGKAE